jgi:ABC-type amino acid transport substrate-binding protein
MPCSNNPDGLNTLHHLACRHFNFTVLTALFTRKVSMCVLASVMTIGSAAHVTAKEWIYHLKPESATDTRFDYPVALLALSLSKVDSDYQLRPFPIAMTKSRAFRQLASGESIDVIWSLTSPEREAEALPIRIPIDRGLLGWRLLLIRANDAHLFSEINSVADLATLRAGQGHDWHDISVLRTNNFNVIANYNYEALFDMLDRGHIDYIPRGLVEIWPEISAHETQMALTAEPHLVLQYPAAHYFFVNKHNTQLATAIETGLQRAIADGSMEKLFMTYYGEAIARTALQNRTIIHINDFNLPEATPLNNKAYWFTIADSKDHE